MGQYSVNLIDGSEFELGYVMLFVSSVLGTTRSHTDVWSRVAWHVVQESDWSSIYIKHPLLHLQQSRFSGDNDASGHKHSE